MREYTLLNVWISPQGEVFEVALHGHNEFALNFLVEENLFSSYIEKKLTSGTHYLEDLLHWRRIHQWSSMSSPEFILADNLKYNFSKRQVRSIIDLCLKENIEIPERFRG